MDTRTTIHKAGRFMGLPLVMEIHGIICPIEMKRKYAFAAFEN